MIFYSFFSVPSFCSFFLYFFLVLAMFPYVCVSLPLIPTLFLVFAHTLLLPHTGSLIQVPMSEKGKITRGRLGSLSLKKEGERQCFLFSKHLIICTRGSGGKLHLTKVGTHTTEGLELWLLIRSFTKPAITDLTACFFHLVVIVARYLSFQSCLWPL